jgi:hypothetical protein
MLGPVDIDDWTYDPDDEARARLRIDPTLLQIRAHGSAAGLAPPHVRTNLDIGATRRNRNILGGSRIA